MVRIELRYNPGSKRFGRYLLPKNELNDDVLGRSSTGSLRCLLRRFAR